MNFKQNGSCDQLWPKNVITQILQTLYDFIYTLVSNCVVNLSPKKDLVMKEVYRILKPGGEFYFSDVFVDRRLRDEIAFDPILHSECLGGALYVRDFINMSKEVGFKDPRILTSAPITIR